jgi:hypothetical protein
MRQSDVDCTPGTGTTGNVTENRRYLSASGPIAVTDMTYDGEGKLTTITGPPISTTSATASATPTTPR